MKKVIVVAAIGLFLSGCSGTHTYVTTDGMQVETSTNMAYLMSVRDIEKVRVQTFNENVALSDRPEQVVALVAAMFGAPGQKVERPKTWDERALPWVATLTPIFTPFLYGYANQGGGSENVTIDGTGNSVVIANRNAMTDSYIYPVVSPNIETNDWTATDSGTNAPDHSVTTMPPEYFAPTVPAEE